MGRGFAQQGLELSRKTGAGYLGRRETPWAVDLWQPGTLSSFPFHESEKVSFTINHKMTKTLSGLWLGRAATAVGPPSPAYPSFSGYPERVQVSWLECHLAPTPTGLSEQQATLRQGDLHL